MTMSSNQNPSPAEILAGAEQERHVLLEQAARQHLDHLRTEARRYEEELAHIESVFAMRITLVPEVPEWITSARQADIKTALLLTLAASDADLEAWISQTEMADHGTGSDRAAVQHLLSVAADEPAAVYAAWVVARQIIRESRTSTSRP
jgi:hypothetical protein